MSENVRTCGECGYRLLWPPSLNEYPCPVCGVMLATEEEEADGKQTED